MPAITGNYTPRLSRHRFHIDTWLRRALVPHETDRPLLAMHLLEIRKCCGTHEASEFRDYLLWLGVYPVKLK